MKEKVSKCHEELTVAALMTAFLPSGEAEAGGSQTRSEPRLYPAPPLRLTMPFLNFKTKSKIFMRNNKSSFPKTNTFLNN